MAAKEIKQEAAHCGRICEDKAMIQMEHAACVFAEAQVTVDEDDAVKSYNDVYGTEYADMASIMDAASLRGNEDDVAAILNTMTREMAVAAIESVYIGCGNGHNAGLLCGGGFCGATVEFVQTIELRLDD